MCKCPNTFVHIVRVACLAYIYFINLNNKNSRLFDKIVVSCFCCRFFCS